ncbi:MAG: exo-beta-N-acetylmuramidase NamZ domain-containing protein [Pyrinomonadaceae bacterium]
MKKARRVTLGIEKLCVERADLIKGRRVGLVCNQASVDHELRHSADLLKSLGGVGLKTLFGPQHGIRGDVQDNMVETPHTLDTETGLPVYSLYSETREPTEEMLEDLDVLVCDLQDVGCRIYTFVYTIANCMRAARRLGKPVIVCDRPNPIGGVAVEGNLLEAGFESFVGQFQLPTRHGMTAGELSKMFNEHWSIGCELEVLTMDDWSRDLWFDETDAPWVLPSPNMPTLDSATIFPGTVHLEGTQISEGRGTTRPFELVGAPYVEAGVFARKLESIGLEGVRFRPTNFLPTFQKHVGKACGGVQIHVLDRLELRPVLTGLAVVKTLFDLYGEEFRWKEPPYEYVFDKNPFDVISGTDRIRLSIERGDSLEDLERSWHAELTEFESARQKYLLY